MFYHRIEIFHLNMHDKIEDYIRTGKILIFWKNDRHSNRK